VHGVHPIEHLRYVARARGADPASLVRETAHALSSMYADPAGLVVSCRRILERHPGCGPLWWLCARLLTAHDAAEAAWDLADEIDADETASRLHDALPDDSTVVTVGWPDLAGQALLRRGDVRVLAVDSRHEASSFVQRLERYDVACEAVHAEAVARAVEAADIVLVEAVAVSQQRVVAQIGSAAAAAVAAQQAVPVWLVAGVGRRLPDGLLDALVDRCADAAPWELDTDLLATSVVTHVAGPSGVAAAEPAALAPECPMAPELLRSSPI
jgi:hypothetical protein